MARLQLQLAFTIALTLGSSIGYSTLVQTQPNIPGNQTSSPSPTSSTKPRRPPPPNPTPPTDLNPNDRSCRRTTKPLTALIPKDRPGLTTSGQPTFWFYVPYSPEEIRSGEFSLLTDDDKQLVYRTAFQLPNTPGIISISLPSKYTLEEGKYYHWYLELYCKQNTSSQPSREVDGWIERVALTPDHQRQIDAATPNIWYDSLTSLGNRRLASPQDEKLKNEWTNLLKSVGWEDLAQEPLVGSVQVSEK